MEGHGDGVSYFEKDGRPVFFRLDKSLPLAEGEVQLKDFDFEKYIRDQAKYLRDKLDVKDDPQETVEEALLRNGISSFSDKLHAHIGGAKSQVDLLDKLYADGMPECFLFHTSGDRVIPLAEHGVDAKIKANQLGNQGYTDFSDNLAVIRRYIRLSSEVPVVICYPMREVWEAALDNSDIGAKFEPDSLKLQLGGINFSKLAPEAVAKITSGMRVFSVTEAFARLYNFIDDGEKFGADAGT